MEFSVNAPVLYVIAGAVVLLILVQSVVFLKRALKRAGELGIESGKVRKVIRTAAVFTIAPALSIVIGVITLSKDLGIPLPWLRLSVVGSLSYETIAAANAESAMGMQMGSGAALTASQYVTVLFVMTLSIIAGIVLAAIIGKKLQTGMINMENRDKKWSETFTNAMFIGMISAFTGYVFCNVSGVTKGDTSGLIPVLVFFISMLVTVLCAAIMKATKIRWIKDYALPISMLCGMAAAIPLTGWLG